MNYTDIQTVKQTIFLRPDDANKGTLGSLLSICGSYGMAGAAMMAGEAALRCGLGLLKSALPKSIYPIVAPSLPESVYFPIDETKGKISFSNLDFLLEQADKSKAVLVGCGLGVCDDTIKLVNSLIQNCSVPMVIDADALNCVALNPDVLKSAKAPIIIIAATSANHFFIVKTFLFPVSPCALIIYSSSISSRRSINSSFFIIQNPFPKDIFQVFFSFAQAKNEPSFLFSQKVLQCLLRCKNTNSGRRIYFFFRHQAF